MKKIIYIFLFLPILTFAVSVNVNTDTGTIGGIIEKVNEILDLVIPILMVLATVVFISGLIWYISSTNKEEKQKEAKNLMIWGIIILFVVVAVWGLVSVLSRTFDIGINSKIPDAPGNF